MNQLEKTMNTIESVAKGLDRGLVYIKEDFTVGAYSRLAKEITGIILSRDKSHDKGRIEEGDLVIVVTNELGNDDGLTIQDLELLNIHDPSIKEGDAVIAVGVYKNKKIQAAYKFASSYMPKEIMRLSLRYLGFNIVAEIDSGHNEISISVNNNTYVMKYLEAIGHMVVCDRNNGKVKFFQEKGYSFRQEEVGTLLRGKPFLEKKSKGEYEQEELFTGKTIYELFKGDAFIEVVKEVMNLEDGESISNVYEIYKRPLYCHLVRVKLNNDNDGVYVFLQDYDIVSNKRVSKDMMNQEIERLRRKRLDRQASGIEDEFGDLIGNDSEMIAVKRLAYRASRNKSNVLITGESGTGKSMLARQIHNAQMPDAPFVEVCCNAISHSLIESELFGYVAGAFTGASEKGKAGYFEEANGGTIFLDEIGDLPPEIQIKLLHVIQNKRIYRVGDTKPIDVDVRIISATNRELEKEIQKGNFREDLYYRIGVFPIHMPPLRKRKKDLYFLANNILERCCKQYGFELKQLSQEAINDIMAYPWMGNVRELENIIERAVNICDDKIIYSEHLMLPHIHESALTLREKLNIEEKRIIMETLDKNKGDRKKTIEELGISKASFYQKMREYKFLDKQSLY